MVSVLITGAGGFLGRRLTDALLRAGRLQPSGGGAPQPITRLCLMDRVAVAMPDAAAGTCPVDTIAADIADPAVADDLGRQGFDSIFHLAASLTLDAERDPRAAWAVNVAPLRRLIDLAPNRPRIVFASSIAVFGGRLPAVVDDTIRPCPATTYGSHKAISELMLADDSRLGRIDGRSLRLPIVLTRPGTASPAVSANPAVSDRIAAILREPLCGRDVVAPLAADVAIPVASAGAAAVALIALHDLDEAVLPPGRAMNLPSLTVTIGQMISAVRRHSAADGTAQAPGRISIAPDPALDRIIRGWPMGFVSADASRLGLGADADIEAVIADFLAETLS
ncbi:NAD-dependent epimerase/dehydratase family protein [Tistrella sp. BH-R2-4]|uniref:NAD-dependent epimerase/dehydratase family protein n=1 Tax=Tistrella arctica TaxID=3133430 RepID=A0ABU9YN46_9PROT